jgi:LacI family transcriptional regulator
VTIIDVADRAGVSFKTVSRVLNREPNVRAKTRERVLAAVAELGYRPNIGARSLAGSRSFLIGLMFDNPSEAYVSKLQLGATAQCREDGFHLLIEPLDSHAENLPAAVAERLSAISLDGVVLTQPISDNDAVLDLLEARGLPYVRVLPDHDLDRAPWVGMDDDAAAAAMTRHLLELGHRDIGFIEGDPGHGASALRRRGYLAALKDAGVQPRPELIRPGRFDFRSGFEAAEALLALDSPPTAIFASNDDMALGATMAAHRHGLDLPGELSIAGVDDTPMASAIWPRLTTVRQPIQEMAAAAVDLLTSGEARRRVEGRPPSRLLDFQVLARESTAPPATGRKRSAG